MEKPNPKVTVLMPVYNGEQYVLEAVSSILAQSFLDFELLIIDDGSLDRTVAILANINDSRLRLVQNEQNLGLPATLNKGIRLAKGELIARMDHDDICLPNRLKLQVEFMDARPEVVVCGCGVEVFYLGGETHKHYFPISYDAIKMEALFNSPLSHPGAMIRKEVLLSESFIYDEAAYGMEDYELFSRMLHRHKVANLPYFLLRYRVFGESQTSRAEAPEKAVLRKANISRVQRTNLEQARVYVSEHELDLHYQLSLTDRIKTIDFETYRISEIKAYLYRLGRQATMVGYAKGHIANRIVGKIFLKVALYNRSRLGLSALCSMVGSYLFWLGVLDVVALRIDYLFRVKRV